MSCSSRINSIGSLHVKFCLETWFMSLTPQMILPSVKGLMCREIMSQNSSVLIIEIQPILSLLILGIICDIEISNGLPEQCRWIHLKATKWNLEHKSFEWPILSNLARNKSLPELTSVVPTPGSLIWWDYERIKFQHQNEWNTLQIYKEYNFIQLWLNKNKGKSATCKSKWSFYMTIVCKKCCMHLFQVEVKYI